jgi:hypothetical protein
MLITSRKGTTLALMARRPSERSHGRNSEKEPVLPSSKPAKQMAHLAAIMSQSKIATDLDPVRALDSSNLGPSGRFNIRHPRG